MRTKKTYFGTLSDGRKAHLYSVSDRDISFTASDYGCAVTNIIVNDRNGKKIDVVLGHPTLTGYASEWGSFGAVIGRFANRISGAKFSLGGKEYILSDNAGGVCLHGGFPRWENEVWNAGFIRTKNGKGIRFHKVFEDGYQGFPGKLDVKIDYILEKGNRLVFSYTARTDKETPLSITNHTYFNLSGGGTILHEKLKINSEKILEIGKDSCPTGKFIDVSGTPFDFREEKEIGKEISTEALERTKGYDHCYVTSAYRKDSAVPEKSREIVTAASLSDEKSGIALELDTNCEGLQLYTANYVARAAGKYGDFYLPKCAVCLETQAFPDSPNQKSFPSVILKPGTEYNAVTVLKFSTF